MESYEYFPTQVNRDERPDFLGPVGPIGDTAIDEVRSANAALLQSNCLLRNINLEEFKNYLLLSSVEILRQQGYKVADYDFYLSALWAQEVNKPSGTTPHVHKNSQISGWFFTKVPENGAYVIYHDTRENKKMIELDYLQTSEISNATNSIFFNNLKEGTVLFNNSWVNHQLVSGDSEEPTRCLHFAVSHRGRLCNMP